MGPRHLTGGGIFIRGMNVKFWLPAFSSVTMLWLPEKL